MSSLQKNFRNCGNAGKLWAQSPKKRMKRSTQDSLNPAASCSTRWMSSSQTAVRNANRPLPISRLLWKKLKNLPLQQSGTSPLLHSKSFRRNGRPFPVPEMMKMSSTVNSAPQPMLSSMPAVPISLNATKSLPLSLKRKKP